MKSYASGGSRSSVLVERSITDSCYFFQILLLGVYYVSHTMLGMGDTSVSLPQETFTLGIGDKVARLGRTLIQKALRLTENF